MGNVGIFFFVHSVDMEVEAETRLVSQAREDDEKWSKCVDMGPGLRCWEEQRLWNCKTEDGYWANSWGGAGAANYIVVKNVGPLSTLLLFPHYLRLYLRIYVIFYPVRIGCETRPHILHLWDGVINWFWGDISIEALRDIFLHSHSEVQANPNTEK